MTPQKKQQIINEMIERYNWYSIDEYGTQRLHTVAPMQHAYGWYGNGYDILLSVIEMTGIDWRKSKERID